MEAKQIGYMGGKMEGFKKIAAVDNQFEAQILESILEEKRIPHFLKSFYDSAYDGLFQGQKGWGAVYAAEESQTEILAILAEIRTEINFSQ